MSSFWKNGQSWFTKKERAKAQAEAPCDENCKTVEQDHANAWKCNLHRSHWTMSLKRKAGTWSERVLYGILGVWDLSIRNTRLWKGLYKRIVKISILDWSLLEQKGNNMDGSREYNATWNKQGKTYTIWVHSYVEFRQQTNKGNGERDKLKTDS